MCIRDSNCNASTHPSTKRVTGIQGRSSLQITIDLHARMEIGLLAIGSLADSPPKHQHIKNKHPPHVLYTHRTIYKSANYQLVTEPKYRAVCICCQAWSSDPYGARCTYDYRTRFDLSHASHQGFGLRPVSYTHLDVYKRQL